jgi:hypothetical protein
MKCAKDGAVEMFRGVGVWRHMLLRLEMNERERERLIAFKSPLFDAQKYSHQILFDRIIGGS